MSHVGVQPSQDSAAPGAPPKRPGCRRAPTPIPQHSSLTWVIWAAIQTFPRSYRRPKRRSFSWTHWWVFFEMHVGVSPSVAVGRRWYPRMATSRARLSAPKCRYPVAPAWIPCGVTPPSNCRRAWIEVLELHDESPAQRCWILVSSAVLNQNRVDIYKARPHPLLHRHDPSQCHPAQQQRPLAPLRPRPKLRAHRRWTRATAPAR